MVIASNYGI